MANIIYTGEFMDDAGNLCRVDIHKVGFDGEAAELVMGSNPVTIKTIGTNDSKFEHITPTEAYIEVISSLFLQFVDLLISTQKSHYVNIYRNSDHVWIGWVNPEYYTEEFVSDPHTITIHAVDGLAELKNVLLPIPEVVDYNFKQNALYYFVTCLTQIGLISPNRNIHASINLVATKHDDSLISSRILEEMYFDFRAFQDDDGVMFSCYQVLNEILSAIDARLYQNNFHWNIERIDQKRNDYTIEYYSIGLGIYIGNATENSVINLTANLGHGSTRRFLHPASLEIQPPAKKIAITQEYNMRSNLLNGTSYKLFQEDDFDDDGLIYWEGSFALMPEHRKDSVIDDCLLIYGAGIRTGSITNTIDIEDMGVDDLNTLFGAWKAGRVSLILSFDVGKRYASKTSTNTFVAEVQLRANFSETNAYWLKDKVDTSTRNDAPRRGSTAGTIPRIIRTTSNSSEATFEPAISGDILSIDLTDNDDFVRVNYKVNAPPDEELSTTQTKIEFKLFLNKCTTDLPPESMGVNDGILFKDVRLYFQENFTDDYSRNIETIVDINNILDPPDYEVKFGNTPDNANCNSWGVLHKSVIFDDNGKVLRKWGIAPDSLPVSDLTESILALTDIFTTYRRAQFMLNGILLDTTLGTDDKGMLLNSILKDYDERYYMPLNLSYKMRTLEIEGKWLCIWDDSGLGEFNDDFSEDFFI